MDTKDKITVALVANVAFNESDNKVSFLINLSRTRETESHV